MKKRKKLLEILQLTVLLLLMFAMLNTFNCYIYAADTSIDIDEYENIYDPNNDGLLNIGGKILWIVNMIGTAVAVITLIIIGIQYVTKSPEQKAQVKDRLVTYAIGAVILFAATTIVSIVARFGQNLF